jgi:hypothetical protein
MRLRAGHPRLLCAVERMKAAGFDRTSATIKEHDEV